MKLSALLGLAAVVCNVVACGNHHPQDYERSHDIARCAIADLDKNSERREFEKRQIEDQLKAEVEKREPEPQIGELEKRQGLVVTLTFGGLVYTLNLGGAATTTTTTRPATTTSTRATLTTSTRTTTTTARTTTTTKTTTTTTATKTTTTTRTTTTTTRAASTTSPTTSTRTTTTSTRSTSTSNSSSGATTSATSSRTSTSSTSRSTTAVRATASTNSTGSSVTVGSTILVIARDAISARQATNGLNAYGIPFQVLTVPSTGAPLPALNSSATAGAFGGIIVVSGIAYYYSATDSWASGLTNDQWTALYNYQIAFKVRMVQWDVYPQAAFGTTSLGSCCDSGVEQLIYFTNTTAFTQAGLKTGAGAGLSSEGLWHYITQITDPSTTFEIAQFAANSQYNQISTAAVINNFAGREQMVFFIDWATDWSPTSNYLQHAYITWMTRGLYAGYRRVNLATQIDDVLLPTGIYYPGNSATTYRLTTDDMNNIRDWIPQLQAKMNPGSLYKVELGYNGNGNIRAVDPLNQLGVCNGGPIYTTYNTTALEFQKPLGTGVDGWPLKPTNYSYTLDCFNRDPLAVWFQSATNRANFFHISHTFTHEGQNNATYNDIYKEINWNRKYFDQVGISSDPGFVANGLIPPQITGLHNGDAMRAWADNGLTHCVGDNSRPVLRNRNNYQWPYITNFSANGFDGMVVIPRWPLRIYYNCDSSDCTTQEWKDSTGSTGTFTDLMAAEKFDANVRLFGLYHDGNMFHQLNLRSQNMTAYTTADGTAAPSLLQAWTEQTVQEFNRLANWPMITLKQSDLAVAYTNRMTRDMCNYAMSYNVNGGQLTSVTVTSANGNTCSAAIPVTVPGPVQDTQGFTTEQIGNDPLTVWVVLSGSPVTLILSNSIQL